MTLNKLTVVRCKINKTLYIINCINWLPTKATKFKYSIKNKFNLINSISSHSYRVWHSWIKATQMLFSTHLTLLFVLYSFCNNCRSGYSRHWHVDWIWCAFKSHLFVNSAYHSVGESPQSASDTQQVLCPYFWVEVARHGKEWKLIEGLCRGCLGGTVNTTCTKKSLLCMQQSSLWRLLL